MNHAYVAAVNARSTSQLAAPDSDSESDDDDDDYRVPEEKEFVLV